MYEHDSPYHHIQVSDSAAWRTLRFERNRQSSMALDDPFESDLEYVEYFHLAMAIKPDAARTLVIGLGGGSVVKRMWRDYPGMHVDVAEIDPEVADIARGLFALPVDERISVTIGDGRVFVQTTVETYDIVIVDAFDDDRVPRHLTTEEFMREVRDRMSPDGVLAYNFIGSLVGLRSRPFRSLFRTVSNVWRRVWAFPVGYSDNLSGADQNIIVLATDVEISDEELLARIASRVDGLVTVRAFQHFGDDLYRGAIRRGDVPLILDEPSAKRAPRGGKRRS
jgi:spermidine synthase